MRIALLFQLYFAFAVGFGEKAELGDFPFPDALVTLGCLKNSIALLVSLLLLLLQGFSSSTCKLQPSMLLNTALQYAQAIPGFTGSPILAAANLGGEGLMRV